MMIKTLVIIVLVLILVVIGYFIYSFFSKTPVASQDTQNIQNAKNPVAVVETSMGSFEFELYKNDAPLTVDNFTKLTGKNFYDNLIFHRVVKGFVIQGGDPKGDGTGGPGYAFADELNPQTKSYQEGYVKGVVAMANAGLNTNGSQWFVTLADLPQLPHAYTIFGKVTKGQEVVDQIGLVAVGANDRPLSPVVIKKITIN